MRSAWQKKAALGVTRVCFSNGVVSAESQLLELSHLSDEACMTMTHEGNS